MKWSDDGIILGARAFGEGGLVIDVLTASRGRRAGLVYGGGSRRRRAQFELGNTLALTWMARTEDQLGRFDVAELRRDRASTLLEDPGALAALGAITAILRAALNEGDTAASVVYPATDMLLDTLTEQELWPALYVRWELGLLSSLGFGLDLSACALTGGNDGLTHVSPKTGRAVRGSEAAAYLPKLLALPAFLVDPSAPVSNGDVVRGLALTGHFFETRLFSALDRGLPPERGRLVARLQRSLSD